MEKNKNKKPVEVKAPKWELKDRIYRLLSKRKPEPIKLKTKKFIPSSKMATSI